MTKKDYQLVADCLVNARKRSRSKQTVDRVTHHLSNAFEQDNTRFDRDVFLIAAGVKDRRYQ